MYILHYLLLYFGVLVLRIIWKNSTGKYELTNPDDTAEATFQHKPQIMRKKQAISLLNLPESQGDAPV